MSAFDPAISFGLADESNVVTTEAILAKKTSMLFPLFSSKGDRAFREFVRSTDLRDTLGTDIDDYDKYGQQGLNAVAAIAGGASIFACRLLPADAVKSAIVIGITTKPNAAIPQWKRLADGTFDLDAAGNKKPILSGGTTGPQVTAAGLEVGVVKITVADWSTFDPTPKTVGGITTYPVYVLKCYSDGLFGNNFGHSIQRDISRDRKVVDGRRYIMTLFEKDNAGVTSAISDLIYFSFSKGAVLPNNSRISERLTSVYPEFLPNAKKVPIDLTYYQTNWDALMLALLVYSGTAGINDIDPFFVLQKNGTGFDKLIPSPTTLVMGSNSIQFLTGGNDGSLQIGVTVNDATTGLPVVVDQARVDAFKSKLLVDFYNCDYNADLLDRRLITAGFALDADYPTAVKTAMIGMSAWREDIVRFIDFGTTASNSPAAALTKYQELILLVDTANAWNVVFVPHAGITTDQNDNKRVSMTYELAWDIPSVYARYGRYTILAGATTGKVTHMKLDWTAQLTKDNIIQKLNDAGLIYAQLIDKSGIPVIMNAETQYNLPYSKLKSWRNGAIVGDSMRNAAAILIKYNFDPRGAVEALDAARRELNAFFSENAYPGSVRIEINLIQTATDLLQDNATCEIIFYLHGEMKWLCVIVGASRAEDYQGGN